jgi:hypothetical protein
MASYRAVAVVSEAIIRLLSSNYRFDDFNNQLEFKVYVVNDFTQPMAAGVSLFLYRILPNGSHRTPSGRLGPNGQRYRTGFASKVGFAIDLLQVS